MYYGFDFLFYLCEDGVKIVTMEEMGEPKGKDLKISRDRKICEILITRNQRGMELLFNAYYKSLVVWADTFLNDLTLAEDVVQDFFIFVWNSKLYLKFKAETLSSFLCVSVRNRCFNKKERRDVFRHAMELDQVELVFEEYNEQHDVIVARVLDEIALLPERSREIMTGVFVDGLKYREVAERYGISVSTVKTLLWNSVKRLREKLDREMFMGFLLFFASKMNKKQLNLEY